MTKVFKVRFDNWWNFEADNEEDAIKQFIEQLVLGDDWSMLRDGITVEERTDMEA